MSYSAAIVFKGSTPTPGSVSHDGEVIYSSGERDAVSRAVSGQISPLDVIIELRPTDAGDAAWLLLQSQPDDEAGAVLVVEDNSVNLEFYRDTIADIGLRVHAASTAEQAVQIARAHPLNLIIIDVRLPDANGFELCRTLGAEVSLDRCPMILMSADPDLADNDRVEAVGASGFIINPIKPAQLVDQVTVMLDRSDVHELDPDATASQAGTLPRLRFFGRPAVEVNGRWETVPPGRATDLLATMAAACPAAVTSEQLARFAWPSSPDVSASAVYTAVSRLRSFLSDVGLPDLVGSDRHGYFLDVEPDQIDLVEFEEAARQVLASDDAEANDIRTILDRWLGAPFPNSKNGLLGRWSNRLTETRSRLIEALAVALVEQGETSEASSVCRDLLVDEPWRESMWSLLITSLYRSGRTNDALQVFAEARQRLRDELGLDPGPTLANLEMMVLTHDPLLLDDSWLATASAGVPSRVL